KQNIIHGQGEMHLDVIRHKAEQNFGVQLQFAEPRIPATPDLATEFKNKRKKEHQDRIKNGKVVKETVRKRN
ncbi:MAG: hypothetical protein ACKOZV_09290, partial [Bacteroidota bacterium]